MTDDQLVFGPIPSRRLGQSLGINHIPPKVCSYSCVYCQVGRTTELTATRRRFYGADRVVAAVEAAVARARERGQAIDHLSLVPDGEPTLDVDLGEIVRRLAPLGIPVAVITNSSLLWREDVRAELVAAAWVSVKVDAVTEEGWRRVNRASRELDLETVLDGIRAFAGDFDGFLATETMLVAGANDGPEEVRAVGEFLAELQPDTAFLAVPTRPPAEGWAGAPPPSAILAARDELQRHVARVELLVDATHGSFGSLGEVAPDLVAICAVHPMDRDAAAALLRERDAPEGLLEELLQSGELECTRHEGREFLVAGWQRRAEEVG